MFVSLLREELNYWLLTKMRRRTGQSARFAGIVVPVDDLIGRRVMATGAFERTQFDAVDRMLDTSDFIGVRIDQNGLFVDVGANIGLYCVAYAQRFRAALAVEANPHTCAVLRANLGLRGLANVTALCEGASDDHRQAKIYVPTNGNLGWATLNPRHHDLPLNAYDILCRPLDAMVDEFGANLPVSLLKIDVEGHERAVLNGAREILARDRPVVLFEVLTASDGRACGDLLTSLGYDRFWTFERWPRGGGKLRRLAKGAFSKLDVRALPLTVDAFHHAPLVCAVAAARPDPKTL